MHRRSSRLITCRKVQTQALLVPVALHTPRTPATIIRNLHLLHLRRQANVHVPWRRLREAAAVQRAQAPLMPLNMMAATLQASCTARGADMALQLLVQSRRAASQAGNCARGAIKRRRLLVQW